MSEGYSKGARLITKSDVVKRSEGGNWGPRTTNYGRVQFTFREYWFDEANARLLAIGTDDDGAEFRWPAIDVTDNPSAFPQPDTTK